MNEFDRLQSEYIVRATDIAKTRQQAALERSELWKLYMAIAQGTTDTFTLLNLAREANAEFCRNWDDC